MFVHGLQEDLLAVSKRLDHIEWKTEMMQNQMGDMDKSQGMMDRLLASSKNAIETLTYVYVWSRAQ